MNKPLKNGVKTVSAASGLFAEIINAFAEKLDYKAILVFTILAFTALQNFKPTQP